ncbi:MAG: redoxin domain-containing protein [Clostridiales bacterium]|nr:redoxin domain-containing protein [Clostridiales bacterium]
MSKWRKIAIILLCITIVTSLALAACKSKGYTIYVKSLGGVGVSDVTVTVNLPDGPFTSKTDSDGKVEVKAKKGEYDVTVADLPLGYSTVDSTYKTSKDDNTLVIYVKSSVILDTVPDNKVYKEGDVMYDFSITDKTGSSDETYTLSEVLKTKKMVLLNFWNTHCTPCMGEMPELELAYRQYVEDAEVFGINVPLLGADRLADVKGVRSNQYTDPDGNKFSLTFPLALDDNNMPYHFAMTAIPVSVVIDRYGVVALIHTGSMDKSNFVSLFAKYTSDDYVQDGSLGGGNGGGDGEELEWAKPNVTQQESSVIEAAINGANFNGSYHPDTESADAEFSWPWLVGETNNEKYIYPANHEVNYSFATIYTSVTISDVSAGSNVVLVFDLQWSCENLCDYFYVIINDMLVYEYTGTEQWGEWQDCYALVADEPGDYTLCLMYVKDQEKSEGADTVRIKNMRMITTSQITADSLDMPRQAARGWNDGDFTSYVSVVKDSEGFYHKDTVDGPYILADLMSTTPFNKRLNTRWSIAEFAINDYFNYNEGLDIDDPDYYDKYDPTKDDTDAITLWAMAANNSELPGLTLVNDELIALLNKFFKTQVTNFNDNMWLELCKYFDHYGTDESDTGINNSSRNPIRGLLNSTAVPTVKAHDGAFNDLKNIPDEYKNNVLLTRLIVPRGFKYVFVPEKSGVYRFRSQSKELCDTMAWLHRYEDEFLVNDEDFLVTTVSQLENPDESYNFILTYYLEAGRKYILATCFSDMYVTGEYTFTVEYLGTSYYSWQYASRNNFTTSDDDMTQIVNYFNVMPVLHTDGKYYNAKKDADGNYIADSFGNYVANLSDPIYVDFLTGARFFDNGSLGLCFSYSDKATVVKTLSGIFSVMWSKPKPSDAGWPDAMPLASIKGSALTNNDWDKIIERLYAIYGDSVYIEGEYVDALKACNSIGSVADFLKKYYLNFFDQTYIRYDSKLGIPESRYKDYTDIVLRYYNAAKAYKGNAERGYADRGCVQLTEELRDALDMFCKRVGGFPELDTDWMRLCAHFEYLGPYQNS